MNTEILLIIILFVILNNTNRRFERLTLLINHSQYTYIMKGLI